MITNLNRKVNIVRCVIFMTLFLGIVLLLSPFKVMADGVEANPTLTITYNSGEGAKIQGYVTKVNNYTKDVADITLLSFTSDSSGASGTMTGVLTIDFSSYRTLSQSEKQNVMGYALDSVKDSDISAVASNKIYNFIQSQDESTASLVRQLSNDVDADFADAYMMFRPFSGVLGTVLGVFAIVIFITLTMMILVDLSYLVIPIIRDFLTPESSGAKPKFVSNEAWYAVKEVDGDTKIHRDVLLVYLKKKTMQFIALSICILYLISGQIYNLIGNLMDSFGGMIG